MANQTDKQRAQDRILYCDNCGISFLWSKEEQEPQTNQALIDNPTDTDQDVGDNDDSIVSADNGDSRGNISEPIRYQAERAGQEPIAAPTRCPGCRVILPPADLERGLVKWFNRRRRYGFVIRRDTDEIFAHGSDIVGRQSMRPGDLVEFRVVEGDRGLMAKEIHIVDHTDEPIAD